MTHELIRVCGATLPLMNEFHRRHTAWKRDVTNWCVGQSIHANPGGGINNFQSTSWDKKTYKYSPYTVHWITKGIYTVKYSNVKKMSRVDRYNSRLHTSKGYFLCPKHIVIKSSHLALLLKESMISKVWFTEEKHRIWARGSNNGQACLQGFNPTIRYSRGCCVFYCVVLLEVVAYVLVLFAKLFV